MPISLHTTIIQMQKLFQAAITFSLNETSIDEWESGPRINYGINWFIDNNSDRSLKFTIGQSYSPTKAVRTLLKNFLITTFHLTLH